MAILNMLLMALAFAACALWVSGLAESDGKCHYEDCEGCPYEGDCPMEDEHEE